MIIVRDVTYVGFGVVRTTDRVLVPVVSGK
jgi:hypothetical protein